MWRSIAVIAEGARRLRVEKKEKHHEHFISPPVTPYARPKKEQKRKGRKGMGRREERDRRREGKDEEREKGRGEKTRPHGHF